MGVVSSVSLLSESLASAATYGGDGDGGDIVTATSDTDIQDGGDDDGGM